MANDNEQLILTTKIEVDESSLAKAQKAFDNLQKSAQDAAKGITSTSGKIGADFRTAIKDVNALDKEFDDLRASINGAAEAKTKFLAQNAQDRLGSLAGGQTGGTPQDLATLGRNIRNLPSVQIPGQAFGTDTVARGIELAGKFGLTLNQLIGTFAVAGVAVGALTLVVGILGEESRKNAEIIKSASDVVKSYNAFVNEGGTTEQAKKRIEDLKQQIKTERDNIAELEGVQQKLIDSRNVPIFAEFVDKLNINIAGFGADINQFDTEIGESEKSLALAELELRKYNEGIDSNELAANDAAEAEKKLADERSKSALAAAQLAGTLAQTLAETESFGLGALEAAQRQLDELLGNDTAGAGEQAVESRLRSIENQKKAVQAQIEALRQSGVTTQQVTEQIAALEAQLSTLGVQANIVQESLGAAKARDNETEAILDQVEALKAAQQAEKQAAQEAEQRAKQLSDLEKRRTESLASAQQKYYDSLEDLQTKFNEDQLKAIRDANREIRDIETDARRERRDALAEGRFLELSNIEQKRQDSLEDLQTQLRDEAQERAIAAREQQNQLRVNLSRQNRDIQTAYENNMKNIVGIVSTGARGVEQAFSAMMSSLKRSASGGSMVAGNAPTSTSSATQSTTLAGLRFVRSS